MVRYFCQNCDDLPMKFVSSVVSHVYGKHGIEVTREKQMIQRAYDARSASKQIKIRLKGFRCKECDLSLDDVVAFLSHIHHVHGIHIWYEKGLERKKVFFDGTLEEVSANNEAGGKEFIPVSKRCVPISQRPYEPRKSSKEEDETTAQEKVIVEKRKGKCARCQKETFLIDGFMCAKCLGRVHELFRE
jgi:hypothetical protein